MFIPILADKFILRHKNTSDAFFELIITAVFNYIKKEKKRILEISPFLILQVLKLLLLFVIKYVVLSFRRIVQSCQTTDFTVK